jgi:hypothetical protein
MVVVGGPRKGRRNGGWRSSLHPCIAHVEPSHLDIVVEVRSSVGSQEAAEVLQPCAPTVVIIIRAGTREVETICVFAVVLEFGSLACWLGLAL